MNFKSFADKLNNADPRWQNTIIGVLTGVVVMRLITFFWKVWEIEEFSSLTWTPIFVVGGLFGLLIGLSSGYERMRYMRMRREKFDLEKNVLDVQRALKKATTKYRLIIENITDAIYLTTEKGRMVLYNEAMTLLTGYSDKELRNMAIDDFRILDADDEQSEQAWIDNGISRFVEKWKTKTGDTIDMEVCAKWIKVSGNQMILHNARDIAQRKDQLREQRILDLSTLYQQQYASTAAVSQLYIDRLYQPLRHMNEAIQYLLKKYNLKEPKVEKLSDDVKNRENTMKFMLSKIKRDSHIEASQWELNTIIKEELEYIKLIAGDKHIIVRSTFEDNLPPVWGIGKDFSIAFEPIFQGILTSLEDSSRPEMILNTELDEDHFSIQIKAPDAVGFRNHYLKILDPACDEDDPISMEAALAVAKSFFDTIGGRFDITEGVGKGVNIRIRFAHHLKVKYNASIKPGKKEVPKPPPQEPIL